MQEARPTYGLMKQPYENLKRYEKVYVPDINEEPECFRGTKMQVSDLAGDLHWVEIEDVLIEDN